MSRPVTQDTPPPARGAESPLQRGLALLDALGASDGDLSIRELARRSGLPRSTTHRLAVELIEWGAMERTPTGVRLGMKLFELGWRTPTSVELRDVALPYAHHLSEVTGLTVNLAVRRGNEILYTEKISKRQLRVPHTRIGGRGTVHATALGKAILAFSPPRERVVAEPLLPLTEKTITDPGELGRELVRVRAAGVAFDVEESQLGLFCVAAPILDSRRTAVAAISVTGATALADAQRFAPAVRTTSMAIARARQFERRRRSLNR